MSLLRRRPRPDGDALRLYYASDIHGTESLWRKFLNAPRYYRANVIVMGGDITGKAVIPIFEDEKGWSAQVLGGTHHAASVAELEAIERRIRGNGMYPYRTTLAEVAEIAALPDEERERWFEGVMVDTFDSWIALADDRLRDSDVICFVMPGNDDPPRIEDAIERGESVRACDDTVVEFDGYSMLSLGYSNRTPWNSPREMDEDDLYRAIESLAEDVPDMRRCIFNLHVPPYDSRLDVAAEIDEEFNIVLVGREPHMIPVGSTAVREAIEKYQPLASLHGHIHESPGVARIGNTTCINPGSDYDTGRIAGCLLTLLDTRVVHQFVTG
jgi:uncharacterized protein